MHKRLSRSSTGALGCLNINVDIVYFAFLGSDINRRTPKALQMFRAHRKNYAKAFRKMEPPVSL